MLTLLYGTRGARDEIFSRISQDVKDGRRAYLIVPDQKALLAESALMNTLPKNAALLVDAVGFSRLSNLVSRRYGALTYNYASEGAKVLTMYRTVKKLSPYLNVFGGHLQNGTLESLCSLMNEFRASSVCADDIANAADKLGQANLAKKLHDLALIYTDYENTLHEKFSEQADDIDTLASLLTENDFFGDAHIYIDSFISFTKQELAVISRILSRGSDIVIALPFSRRGAHMAECADTRKKLLSLCSKLSVKLDEKYIESHSPAPLEFAKNNLWDLASSDTFEDDTSGVLEVAKCENKSDETSLVLREIFIAISNSHSYSDIAIIARNADSYAGILDRALSRANIPFFFSRKKSAEVLPLTRFIISALSLYVYNFKESDVAAYIKTGLVGISDDECDIFEEYINRWGICGRYRYLDSEDFTMSGSGYTSDETDMDTLADINTAKRKIVAPLSRFCDSLDGAKTVRDFCTAVYEYLSEMNIREKSCDENFAKYFGTSCVSDSIRLWNITMEALDTMVDASGDEDVTAADFCTLVKLLFASIDISEIPSSKDQVIIGNADTIRIDERKIVIILGANEGVFPAAVSESPTLCESERKLLDSLGVSLSQNMALRSARELYHFVKAIDFATKKAVISYYETDIDGAKCTESFAVTRLFKLFEKLHSYSFSDLCAMDKLFYSAHAAEQIGTLGKETEALLCKTLSPRGMYTPPLPSARLLTNESAALSKELASNLHGENMRLSQSRIDTYSDCHLNYFLRYMLSLEDTAPFEFNPANTGTFIHSILENFIIKVKKSGKKLADITPSEAQTLATTLCAAEVEKIMRSGENNSARMLCFFERMRRNVLLIVKNLINEFKNSSFEPLALEYKIGLGGHKPLTVTLPDGASVSLNGIADRVDIFKKDSKVYLRIADYKTGDKKFNEKDLQKGKNLQLLIYLFSLCTVADKGFFDLVGVETTDDILPAGATYFIVKPPRVELEDEYIPSTTDFAEDALKRSGFIFDSETLSTWIDKSADKKFSKGLIEKNGEEIDALFKTVKDSITNIACGMRSGDIGAAENDASCRYCAYAHICRKENLKGDDEDNG